jgi:hypothetical protein
VARFVVELPPEHVQAGEAAIRASLAAVSQDFRVLNKATIDHERELRNVERGFKFVQASIDPTVRIMRDWERALKLADDALERKIITEQQHAAEVEKANQHYSGFNEAREAVDRLAASYDPAIARAQRYAAEVKILDDAMALGAITGDRYAAMLEQAKTRAEAVEKPVVKATNSLKEFKSALGKTVAGALIFDTAIKAAQKLDDQLHILGDSGREIFDALGRGFEAARRLDLFGVLEAVADVHVQMALDVKNGWEETYRFLRGEESARAERLRTEAEYLRNLENARRGAARRGAAVEATGDILGDPAALRLRAQGIADAVRNAEGGGRLTAGAPTAALADEVREALDAFDRLGLEAPAALQEVADRYGILSSAAEEAADLLGRQQKEATDKARAAQEAFNAKVDAFIAKANPYRAELRGMAAEQRDLAAAIAAGAAPAEDLADWIDALDRSLAAAGPQLEKAAEHVLDFGDAADDIPETFEISTAAVDDLDAAILEAYDSQGQQIDRQAEFNEGLETALALAEGIGAAFGGWDDDLGAALGYAVQLVQAFQAAQQAQTNAQRIQAASAVGASLYGLGQSLGIFDPGGGRSQYGGKKSGNYSAEASQIGAIIGGALTSQSGGWGAAVGSVIGGILGGAIKKGADEGLAILELTAYDIETTITKNEGGLGSILGGVGESIEQAVDQVIAALGGELVGLPNVGIKIRDDLISVTVGNVKARFKEMDEAISFAVSQILQQGEITGGLSPNVKAALENSVADTLEGLLSDIDFARAIDQVGLDEVEIAIQDLMARFRSNLQRAVELGLDTSKVGLSFGLELTELRNQLLGIQEDPRAALQRRSQLFNAQVQMAEAEIQLSLAKHEAERAALQAEVQLAMAEGEVGKARLDVRGAMVQAEAGYVQAEQGILLAALKQLQALDAIIEAELAALDSIPDLISDSEIAAALGRLGKGAGGFGGGVANFNRGVDRFEAAVQGIEDTLDRLAFDDSVSALTGREQVDLAYAEYQRLLTAAQRGDIEALEGVDDAALEFAQLYNDFTGGGEGHLGNYREVWTEIRDALKPFTEMSYKEFKDQNVLFDERFHRTAEDHLATSRFARAETDRNLKKVVVTEVDTQTVIRTELRSLGSQLTRAIQSTPRYAA